MTHSVELGHVYRAELEAEGIEAWASRARADADSVSWEDDATLLLFVDDYPQTYSPEEKLQVAHALRDEAESQNLFVDWVAFESSLASCADVLADNLPHDEGWLWKQGTGHWRATLIKKEEEGLFTCAALSAAWTLARLGVQPYLEAVLSEAITFYDDKPLEADTILTVLPVTYIDNEAAVVEILRQLRKPRIPLSRVQYVLT